MSGSLPSRFLLHPQAGPIQSTLKPVRNAASEHACPHVPAPITVFNPDPDQNLHRIPGSFLHVKVEQQSAGTANDSHRLGSASWSTDTCTTRRGISEEFPNLFLPHPPSPSHHSLGVFDLSAGGGKDEMNDPLENKQANKNPTGTTIGEG